MPDPEAYKQYKQDESMYDLGTKAGEIWRSISGPIQKVSDLIKGVNTGTENFKKKIDGLKAGMEAAASSPFIQALQTIFEAAADNVEIFDPLTRAFDSLNKSLERAKETCKGTGDHLNSMGITWQSVGQAIAVVAGTIIAVIAGVISIIINLVMVIVEFVVRIVGHIIESIAGFVSGFIQMFQGLWDIIVGLCTGNWQKVLEGIVKFVTGAYEMLHSGWTLMTKMVGDILEGTVALVIRLFAAQRALCPHAGSKLLLSHSDGAHGSESGRRIDEKSSYVILESQGHRRIAQHVITIKDHS